jgi:hypothetical protein
MSAEGWLEVAEKIDPVACGDAPGHAYVAEGDVQIMVSRGEYSDEWWERSEPAGGELREP